MTEYLFLVPRDGGWVQASVDGVPLSTFNKNVYPGMPLIQATEHIDYKILEEHIEEVVSEDRRITLSKEAYLALVRFLCSSAPVLPEELEALHESLCTYE